MPDAVAVVVVAWLCLAAPAWASSLQAVHAGNELYTGGKYTDAIKQYDEALVDQPGAVVPKFNKANSYYKLDDLGQAIDLYQQVATESKDMQMVAKAKYNVGDCLFQRGTKQKDSDLQKAVDDMKSSISWWRQVLDIDPKNEKAAKNIEVARLTIKDLLDQLKKQQEKQKQDPNQPQNQSGGQKDPNQASKAQEKQDPNQAKQQQKEQEQQKQGQEQAKQQQRQVEAQDATAREILDKEQRQKQQRQILQSGQIQKVDRDW